jgi:hypothetical protein
MQLPRPEDIHAKTLAYLENRYDDLSQINATSVIEMLKRCELSYRAQIYPEYFSEMGLDAYVFITLDPVPYDEEAAKIVYNPDHLFTKIVIAVIAEVLPEKCFVSLATTKYQYEQAFASQKEESKGIQNVSNQAAGANHVIVWRNLSFRSESERRIAEALDKAGVLFFPNCKARLGPRKDRENFEPDFLVCHKGKWGILEVDGEPYHPATRTVEDHERDRFFRLHGIPVVEHYDAAECFENADKVVQQFLFLVSLHGR